MFAWYLRFCLEGISVLVNKPRKLNSQAHKDLCLFPNANQAQFFFSNFCCMIEEGSFENAAASKLRCELDPSLSVLPYVYSM